MPLPPCSRVMTRTEDAVIVWSRHKLEFQSRRISYPGFLQSSAVRFVELSSETNPEQPRSLKKGSAAARLGVRHADRDQGDRSLRSMREPSLWRTPRIEGLQCLALGVVLYRRSPAPSGRVDFVLRKIADAVRHYGRSGAQCREASGGAQDRVDRGLVTHSIVFLAQRSERFGVILLRLLRPGLAH